MRRFLHLSKSFSWALDILLIPALQFSLCHLSSLFHPPWRSPVNGRHGEQSVAFDYEGTFCLFEDHYQITSWSFLLYVKQRWLSQQDLFSGPLLSFSRLSNYSMFFGRSTALAEAFLTLTQEEKFHPEDFIPYLAGTHPWSFQASFWRAAALPCMHKTYCPNRCPVPAEIGPTLFFSPFSLLPYLSLCYQV